MTETPGGAFFFTARQKTQRIAAVAKPQPASDLIEKNVLQCFVIQFLELDQAAGKRFVIDIGAFRQNPAKPEADLFSVPLAAALLAEWILRVNQITESCSFIAPVTAYPGEFEMEAMAAGAIRVLNGEEELKEYTGKLVWDGFDFE